MELAKNWLILGALFGGLSVMLGAFGAHALQDRLSSGDLEIFNTGVKYQMYHALALLFLSVIAHNSRWLQYAGYAFTAGILLFSGSLYILVMTNTRWLGAITPFGGVSMIIGWGFIIYYAIAEL